MTRDEQYTMMPKIMKKAIKNGWKKGIQIQNLYALYPANYGRSYLSDNFFRIIILNHDFAKAFFGEKTWKCHLMQMVLLSDPLEYIKEFLEKEEKE